MSIINELERIGKNEINFSISYFYDGQWIFKLGDDMSGYTYEKSFNSIKRGMSALIREIIEQFPDSEYIKKLKERSSSVFQGLDFFR